MKQIILALLSICMVGSVNAQKYKEEIYSGYKGPINQHVKINDDALNFIVMGDWGRMGGFWQKDVAEQMAATSITVGTDFVISVGDNFYPNGVQSTQDPQWEYSFEDIYTAVNLHENWIMALGNHDYRGNIQAQIDYTAKSRRWYLPATFYDTFIHISGTQKLHLIVLDTNPFIEKYRSDAVKYPDLANQNLAIQLQWLEEKLAFSDSSIQWKMVVGHHPMYSGAKRKGTKELLEISDRLLPLFNKYKVDAYICGHEHDLQIIKPNDGYTTQFLSGAASEIRPTGRTEGTIFAAATPGFMLFTLESKQLLVQTLDYSGKVINTYTINK